jgi:hypothetical protein
LATGDRLIPQETAALVLLVLWFLSNDVVHAEGTATVCGSVRFLQIEQSYGESLHLAQNKMSATEEEPTEHWTVPPEGRVKITFDAAFLAETGEASAGVIIRDWRGIRCSWHSKP